MSLKDFIFLFFPFNPLNGNEFKIVCTQWKLGISFLLLLLLFLIIYVSKLCKNILILDHVRNNKQKE